MLPTKGYFQDIECPFNNTTCGRPYCHFRHKRKPNENIDDNVQETAKNVVPTYKPTPKSELANIHNNKSHIPISYVPDLAFKRERTVRPIPRIEKPTYKPTPLSILSSANKLDTSLPENHEHKETIKDIQENIASNVYDPLKSEINFEDLSNEFDLIDDIINDTDVEPSSSSINDNLIKLESDIEKEQNKLNLLQSELSTSDLENSPSKTEIKVEIDEADSKKTPQLDFSEVIVKKEKLDDKTDNKKQEKIENKAAEKRDKQSEKEAKSCSKERSKASRDKRKIKDKSSSLKDKTIKEAVKDTGRVPVTAEKTSKSHKSSEREKHRKEEKKNSLKESKDKLKSKHGTRDRSKSPKDSKTDKKKSKSGINNSSDLVLKTKKKTKHRTESNSDPESVSSDGSVDQSQKSHKKEKRSSSKSQKRRTAEKSRSKNKTKEKDGKTRNETASRSRSRSISTSKEVKSKHKSRPRSKSGSRHKEKDKKRSRSREKEKEKKVKSGDKDKDRIKSSSKDKNSKSLLKKSHDDRREKRKKSTSESNTSQHDNDNGSDIYHPDVSMEVEDLIPSDIDLDLEDEDETMRECYKIFNEYIPTPIQSASKVEETERKDLFEEDNNLYLGKKRTAHAGAEISSYSKLPPPPKPKSVLLPGQTLLNRYKTAQLAQASKEQENIMNEVKNMMQQPTKRPATTLLEAARQHKIRKLQEQKLKKEKEASQNVVDMILNGTHTASQSQVKTAPKKIAAVPNVALIEKAKERISLIKQQRMQSVKTVAQTQKSGRVAHVPEFTLSEIPDVLQAEKSKLPVNVRTRFLTMLAEECMKLYALKQDAYNRALNEEFGCYEKCKVSATYRNSAMLAVNRLRKEIQDREAKGLGRLLSGETASTEKESDFKGRRFYEHVKKWMLNEEELDMHGYPKESGERGKAIINNRKEVDYSITDDTYRRCSRCSKIYQVDDDGWPLYEEECMYHPLKKRTIRGEQIFLCCKSSDDTGCAASDTHVYDGSKEHLLEGYQTTLPPESDDDPRNIAVYALDCEMCYTTKGLELTRVTVVDIDSKTVYESFVKPLNPIIDYNTRFSGITKDQMDRTSTSILQIQANILHLCNSETILVGHSLESDLKALKIVHKTVIDTSVLFPHKMGLPHKRALRALASELLKKIIQNDVSGHDSAEDAITCMELIRWKLKEELKTRTK